MAAFLKINGIMRPFPFQPFQAVYHVVFPGTLKGDYTLHAGMVIKAAGQYVTMGLQDGTRKRAKVSNVAYRGHCEACRVPAIVAEDGCLQCPQCGKPACTLPPPDLCLAWFPQFFTYTPLIAYYVAQGMTREEARRAALSAEHERYPNPEAQALRERYLPAVKFLGDLLGALDGTRVDCDDTYLQDQMRKAQNAADQPDGADDITRWLERQMGA